MPDVHLRSALRPAGVAAALRRLGERVPEWAWLGALTLLATVLVASQTLQMDAWLTMTDELQYVRLALSITQDHSLLPHIHGEPSGSYSQLYPLLLSPVYGIFGNPTAFKVAHVLNALVMSSTVIPAYLLTRSVVSRRAAAYAVAALSVAIPWMALTLLLWTEPAAYPAFVWTVLALHRALARPSWRRDAVALLALALAFLARTQFLVLGAVLPAAVVLHECGYALTRGGIRSAARALRDALVRSVRGHWLLIVALVLVVLAAAAGPLAELLGPYRSTVGNSSLFPMGLRKMTMTHLAIVGVGIGVVPVVLGLAWLPLAVVRPRNKAAHAFAVLAVLAGVALFIQAGAFVKVYAFGAPNDRYFFYVVPLFLVAGAAFLTDGPRHWAPVVIATLLFGWVATNASYALYFSYSASPPAAFHPVLNGRIEQVADALGFQVSTRGGVRWIVIGLGLALAAGVRLVPMRWLAPAIAAVLIAFGVGETRYVFNKMVPVQSSLIARADWVDQSSDGRPVAMAPSAISPTIAPKDDVYNLLAWWNLEFWNSSVGSVYRYAGARNFTPFPTRPLEVDRRTGRLGGVHLPRLMVIAVRRTDVEPAGRELNRNAYLKLIDLGSKPRVRFTTEGLTTSGSGVLRGGSVLIRVFPRSSGHQEGTRVTLGLKAPRKLPKPQPYRVTTPAGVRAGRLDPRRSVSRRVVLCAGPGPGLIRIASGPVGAGARKINPIGIVLTEVRVSPDRGACGRSR